MKMYLAARMRGVPFLNAPAIRARTATLRSLGHDTVSPVELDEAAGINFADYADGELSPEETDECLMRDLQEIRSCDAVAVMGDWFGSRGVSLEIVFAINRGIPVLDADTLEPINSIDLQTGLICLTSRV